ncbi:nicotinamide-nucleotide amidohydrolase family protein [Gymnodinialimonas sp. 2305UL16-5]|uniref:CinA family protein n=1 Tax=Gymnodinialimonas mytili TaxID=3126503 RepID=UPI0030B04499
MTPQEVNAALRAQGWVLASAESCTGGLIAGAVTDVPGSSDVFDRGFVTYSNAAKAEMLGVDMALIEAHGAVSEQVARAMAHGALTYSAADIAVSVTGIAGPGGSEHKPEGRVCFGLAMRGHDAQVETVDFGALGRPVVRMRSVTHALDLVAQAVAASAP